MRTLLDTNAALRYLLEDIQGQADTVAKEVLDGAEITVEVLAECAYVLEGVYHVSRFDIAEALGYLLDEVTCQRKQVIAGALGYFSVSSLDFVDCILAAEADVEHKPILTFDKKLSGLLRKVRGQAKDLATL